MDHSLFRFDFIEPGRRHFLPEVEMALLCPFAFQQLKSRPDHITRPDGETGEIPALAVDGKTDQLEIIGKPVAMRILK